MDFKSTLNSTKSNIQFSEEYSIEQLTFLDISVIKNPTSRFLPTYTINKQTQNSTSISAHTIMITTE